MHIFNPDIEITIYTVRVQIIKKVCLQVARNSKIDVFESIIKPSGRLTNTGVVSNISQCQIALIYAIARARSLKVSCATVYLFLCLRYV